MFTQPITPNFTLSIEPQTDAEIYVSMNNIISQYLRQFQLHEFLIMLNNPTQELNRLIEPYLANPDIKQLDHSFIRRILHRSPSMLELSNIWRIVILLLHYDQNSKLKSDSPTDQRISLNISANIFDDRLTLSDKDFFYYAYAAISSIKEQILVCMRKVIVVNFNIFKPKVISCKNEQLPSIETLFRDLTNIEFDENLQIVYEKERVMLQDENQYFLVYFSDNKGIFTFLEKEIPDSNLLIGYSVVDIYNFKVDTIYRVPSHNLAQNSICSIVIEQGKLLNVSKQLFIWQYNNKQIMHLNSLLCHKIDYNIDRTTCCYANQPGDDQGYKLIQTLTEKKIEVLLDFDLHIPIQGEAITQQYSEYYNSAFQQVLIHNSTVSILVPQIKTFENFINSCPIKRILLNYEFLKTITLAIDEIRRIFFKLRPKGLILNGIDQLNNEQINILDVILQINFPNNYFYAATKEDQQLFKIQRIFKYNKLDDISKKYNQNSICLYRQNFIDIIGLISQQTLYTYLFSYDQMKTTINNIDLRSLQQISIDRHLYSKQCQQLNLQNTIISLNMELPEYLFSLRQHAINIVQYQVQGFIVIQLEYEAGIKLIIANTGNEKYYNHDFGESFTSLDNQIVEIQQEVFYLEPWENKIYAFRTQQSNLQDYTHLPILYQEFKHFLPMKLFMHSIQVISVNQLYRAQNQTQIVNQLLSQSGIQSINQAKNRMIIQTIYKQFNSAIFNPLILLIFSDSNSKLSVKIPKLSQDLLNVIYEPFILKFMFNIRRSETFFGFDFSLLQDYQRRILSLLFPPSHFNKLNMLVSQNYVQTSKLELNDILSGYFQPDILIITTNITSQVAILAQILSSFFTVLIIAPIYETPYGLQSFPSEFLGNLEYTIQNFENSGIHHASKPNIETLCLHNFQYFNTKNYDFVPQNWSDSCNLLTAFVKHLFPRSFSPPKCVISSGNISAIASSSFKSFLNIQKTVTRVTRQPVPFRETKFINFGASMQDLECVDNIFQFEELRINHDIFWDQMINKVVFMRGIFLSNDLVTCEENVKNQVENSLLVNWCCNGKLDTYQSDLVGMVRLGQKIINFIGQ
ncbi:hypothetical protein SS50377_28071 [Spironucleus salmonicida]|uniref:Uncharacterized protein n=1 Tax=Spironucleus salmonicida TaxID=348837 RepID=V6LEC1_9EUKA|nr:hypothetical protein SS50377_28071 [Spironucleus salmonicida]|eukprot:EST42623.1 hypothetical protein SS50377_17942 [Spironucleus salmonicida]